MSAAASPGSVRGRGFFIHPREPPAEPSPAAVALGLLLPVWAPSCVALPCGTGEPEVLTPPRSGHPGEAAAAGVPEGLYLLATSS